MMDEAERNGWIKRAEAVGQAQSRYLWVLLVVTLFYLALQNSADQTVTVPIVQLKLDSAGVLAAGGATISLLVVAAVGTFLAWAHALEKAFGASWRDYSERADIHPNVFDFAGYTARDNHRTVDKALSTLSYFLFYPTFLALALAEAASLLLWLWRQPAAPARLLLMGLGSFFWLWGAYVVIRKVWWERAKRRFGW